MERDFTHERSVLLHAATNDAIIESQMPGHEGRDGGTEQAIVVTRITDPSIPRDEISQLYWKRWNCELDLRSIKQSMHLDVLRCKTDRDDKNHGSRNDVTDGEQ